MTHTRPWPLVPHVPSGSDGILINHVSDTHFGYRPWSYAESDTMFQDLDEGLVPDVDLFLHTGDIVDGHGDDSTEDEYALSWLYSVEPPAGQSLWCMGNHDIRARVVHTRAQWETVYGRSANTYVDVGPYRVIAFAADDHPDGTDYLWTPTPATWGWVADTAAAHNGPVILADHYPPTELGGVEPLNALLPQATLNDLMGDTPNIVGMMCGHMHKSINDLSAATFVTLGGRPIPLLTDISSMLSDVIGRDYSAQMQSTSAYVTVYPDRWEVRYRRHGSHAWGGPDDQRVTTMDLTGHTVTRGM